MLPSSLGQYHGLCLSSSLTPCSHIFTNPTSYIVVAAEHAAAKILALPSSGSVSGSSSSASGKPTPIQSFALSAKISSVKPTKTSAKPSPTPVKSSAKPVSSVKSSAKPATPTPTNVAKAWEQCGGLGFTGPTTCVTGYVCKAENRYFSQCVKS